MAVRKSMSSTIVVDGDRADWLGRCELALTAAGFKNLSIDRTTHVLGADYHKAMTWGHLEVTLRPADGDLRTEIAMRSTANVDNVFALFRSPNQQILDIFRAALT